MRFFPVCAHYLTEVDSVLSYLDGAVAGAAPVLAVWILLSGADDLFILAVFLLRRRLRRLRERLAEEPSAADLAALPEKRIAIVLPLWKEDAVIGRMIEHNLAAIRYCNYDIFAGAYPNDPATERAIRGAAARSPRVHLAVCPHDGPTSKADCLNWIYQHLLLYERDHDVTFDVIVTHDAEDLVHPEELRVVNYYARRYAMVQVPVLPLPTPVGQWTHGVYCDDFAEYHGKDFPVRAMLGGFVPSSGVGTALTREALDRLAAADANQIFRPECLTEDYEIGYRLHTLGLRQVFVPIRMQEGQPVATREYFPVRFAAARRQRTRWITGIAFQGWMRNGWGRDWREAYWFFRDRKGMVGNPVSLLANAVFLYGAGTWGAAAWGGGEWGLGRILERGPAVWMMPATMAVGAAVLAARAWLSARLYGWGFAAAAPVRSLLGNLLNSVATLSAARRFAVSRWTGRPLAWIKTEHAYPNLAALEQHKRPLEEILTTAGYVSAQQVEEALGRGGPGRLAQLLVESGALSEQDLLDALTLRHNLPAGDIAPAAVAAGLARALPRRLVRELCVVPVGMEEGVLRLACPDLPSAEQMERLRRQTRLAIEFRLVTQGNFRRLVEADGAVAAAAITG